MTTFLYGIYSGVQPENQNEVRRVEEETTTNPNTTNCKYITSDFFLGKKMQHLKTIDNKQ